MTRSLLLEADDFVPENKERDKKKRNFRHFFTHFLVCDGVVRVHVGAVALLDQVTGEEEFRGEDKHDLNPAKCSERRVFLFQVILTQTCLH